MPLINGSFKTMKVVNLLSNVFKTQHNLHNFGVALSVKLFLLHCPNFRFIKMLPFLSWWACSGMPFVGADNGDKKHDIADAAERVSRRIFFDICDCSACVFLHVLVN